MTLGYKIKSRREELGMSQGELAEKAYVTQASISQIESGKYTPTSPRLVTIAHALKLPPAELLKMGRRAG